MSVEFMRQGRLLLKWAANPGRRWIYATSGRHRPPCMRGRMAADSGSQTPWVGRPVRHRLVGQARAGMRRVVLHSLASRRPCAMTTKVDPAPILAVVIGCCLSGCLNAPSSPQAPPIGRDLPGGAWADVSRAFNARVQARFPVGSSEQDMVSELRREKFKVGVHDQPAARYRFSAGADLLGFPCRVNWTIEWNSAAGKVVELIGSYGGSCV
jgi:hypothetical protein